MITAVLFDIDGVLLDSATANLVFYQTLLTKFGYTGPTAEEFSSLNHMSMLDVIHRYALSADHDVIMQMHAAGDTIKDHLHLLRMMPGAQEVVQSLSKDYQLGLVTNRTRAAVQHFFDFSHLATNFSVIACYETTAKHKPDPEPLIWAMARLEVSPAETVFIGDSEVDQQAAEAAGTHFLLFHRYKPGANVHQVRVLQDVPDLIKDLSPAK